ncbi:MAG: dihydropteroate synthase [Verrucomicrobiota bacterium]
MTWSFQNHHFNLALQGEIMAILNVTPDSFSDGGQYQQPEDAMIRARQHVAEGAAILDIGGESTRPGADPVSVEEEIRRVVPVIREVRTEFPEIAISIDTMKASVAAAAIDAGADIINDVTGFRDNAMIQLAAESGVGLVVMHMQGQPRTMQTSPIYGDVISEVREFFRDRTDALLAAGVKPDTIVHDPGIGFGKTLDHNLTLLKHLPELAVADRPLLLGVSRKSFIGRLIDSDEMADRNWPTVALTARAREQGIALHRVHDTKPNLESLRMMEAMIGC